MSNLRSFQSGFTAVELLVTLFVAAAFIIAGYQLFNVVIRDGGDTRAKAAAANAAYAYLRQYSDSATNPCTSLSPLTNEPAIIDGLSDVTVTVMISCAQADAPTLSKIDVTVAYNKDTPKKTLTYSTYVDKSTGASTNTDVTDGLIAWWKFNGNTNSSVGSANATITGAVTSTTDRDGNQNRAYNFDGSTGVMNAQLSGLSGDSAHSISFWIKADTLPSSGHADLVSIGNAVDNTYSVMGISTTYTLWYNYANDISSTTHPTTGQWYLITGTYSGGGATTANKKLYLNGSLLSSLTTSGASYGQTLKLPNPALVGIGYDRSRNLSYFDGSMDDVRIYSRALSSSEVLQLYNGGPK